MKYERPHIEESRSLEAVLTNKNHGRGHGQGGRKGKGGCYSC
jgi:hypothetical protein